MAIINFTRVALSNGLFYDLSEDGREVRRRLAKAEENETDAEFTEVNFKKPAFLTPEGIKMVIAIVEMEHNTLAAAMQQAGGMVVPMGGRAS